MNYIKLCTAKNVGIMHADACAYNGITWINCEWKFIVYE